MLVAGSGPAVPVLPPKSATEATYEALLGQILRNALPAGTPLQERRLAEALGVSRTPLREALSRLEGEGLVVREPGRTVAVRAITIDDYLDALYVRSLLEPDAAARAPARMASAQVADLRDRVQALLADPAPSADLHWAVDDALHETIASAGGSELMAGIIRGLRRKTRIFNLRQMPDRFVPGCHEHLAILGAMAAGDSEAARAAMARHIENVKTSIIQKLAER